MTAFSPVDLSSSPVLLAGGRSIVQRIEPGQLARGSAGGSDIAALGDTPRLAAEVFDANGPAVAGRRERSRRSCGSAEPEQPHR